MTRTLLLCAGDATRWGDHLGRPKHLVEVEGEILLARSVRQFSDLGPVEVVAKPETLDAYRFPPAETIAAELDPLNGGADRFASSRHRWRDGETLVLAFGDVWYSAATIATIAELAAGDHWAWVARFDASRLTQCPNGEGFAFVVPWTSRGVFVAGLESLIDDKRRGRIDRAIGWDLYRRLEGFPLDQHWDGERLARVDDWTDDFDFPADYDRWLHRRHALGAVGQP